MRNQNIPDVFIKPDAPRSNWEIFKWLFFEFTLLSKWSDDNINQQFENIDRFIIIYLKWIVLVIFCWALMLLFVVELDIPANYPKIFKVKIDLIYWNKLVHFWQRWCYLFTKLGSGLAFGLIIGLVGGLVVTLVGGLAIGLAFGLSVGLVVPIVSVLALGLVGSLVGALVAGMGLGLLFGLALRLYFGLVVGLVGGLVGGLIGGLAGELAVGLTVGPLFIVAFYFGQFRLPFYFFYLLLFFKKHTLFLNPYLKDEGIRLPLPWVKRALKTDTKQHPDLAFQFVDFLLRYRPLQQRLAAELEHLATATLWQSSLVLKSTLLNDRHFLDQELLGSWKKYAPSSAWREKIIEIRETLSSAESTTAVVTQQTLIQRCLDLVQDFEAINLRETFKGRIEYFEVIKHWQQILNNQLQEVTKKVAETHAISLNPYSKGVALNPEQAASIPMFLDRADIKEELSLKIQTSAIMPTFLLLGQRRVGKTSLLNFLPRLLDPNYYDVVTIDAQGLSGETSLVAWLEFWCKRIQAKLKITGTTPITNEDSLKAWDEFAAFLDQLAQSRQRRLILAMDEYDAERGFHYAICQNSEIGAAFLGRMRAFSQQQKLVVFMFVGATNFSDLPEPKWSRYFVQAHIVRVDYLSEQASLQLIQQPMPDFGLHYADGVAQHIYQITQGHPHLLHSICSDLVDYANLKLKNPVEMADVEYILGNKIVLSGEQPFSVFWDEFCEKEAMRTVVKAIAFHEAVDPKQAEVRKLLDYGYIVANGSGGYKMRVPLFGDWIKQFGY